MIEKRKKRPSPKTLSKKDPLGDLLEARALDQDLVDQEFSEDPAAVADERKALEESARDWSAEQALMALNEAAASIRARLDLRRLVMEVLDIAIKTLNAERGVIFLGGGEDDPLVPVLALDIDGNEINDIEQISRTLLNASRQAPVITMNALKDARFRDVASVRAKRIRAVACSAMIAGGERVGAIYLDAPTRGRAFPAQCGKFLEVYANLAAIAVQDARRYAEVLRERELLRRRVESLGALFRLNTASAAMATLCKRAMTAALGNGPVLIQGEPGTEKELTARTLHEFSSRAAHPFIHLHCASLPAELILELVGDEKKRARSGVPRLWQRADRGVLFLEEITRLDTNTQARLAALLRSGILREGPRHRRPEADVRLVSSVTGPPGPAILRGELLSELYDQIAAVELHVPPLRERREDIPLLIDHFLQLHGENSKRWVSFTPAALEMLQGWPWRHNVTELENFVHRLLIFMPGGKVDVGVVKQFASVPARVETQAGQTAEEACAATSTEFRSLADQAREAICNALARARGNKSKAARLLGIHRNTLIRRMQRMGIVWVRRPRR